MCFFYIPSLSSREILLQRDGNISFNSHKSKHLVYYDRTNRPTSAPIINAIEGNLTQIIKVSFITARFVNLSATKDRKRPHLPLLSTVKHNPCKQILAPTGGQFESRLVNTTFFKQHMICYFTLVCLYCMCKTWHSKLKVNISDRDRAGWNARKPHISLSSTIFDFPPRLWFEDFHLTRTLVYFARNFSTFSLPCYQKLRKAPTLLSEFHLNQ